MESFISKDTLQDIALRILDRKLSDDEIEDVYRTLRKGVEATFDFYSVAETVIEDL